MKLSPNAVIAVEKMANYLLQWRPESDKSQFLASAGYTERDAELLARDIRRQLLSADAQFEEATAYGDLYSITAGLRGPNGTVLKVKSFWMVESATDITKFITLYPSKDN